MFQSDIDEIRDLTNRFADYFCEDQKKFVLGDYLKVFHQFCEALSKAKEENENFKKVEARRLAREKKAEEDAAKRAAQVKIKGPQKSALLSKILSTENFLPPKILSIKS